MKPQIVKLKPTYAREGGLWVRDLKPELIHLPDSSVSFTEVSIVHIPPQQIGGNHTHPRIELFTCLSGQLELVWLNGTQKQHTLIMKNEHHHEITAYLIPPHLPHVVFNPTATEAFLLEFASESQHDVKPIPIIEAGKT